MPTSSNSLAQGPAEAARRAGAAVPSSEPWICHLERLVRMMQTAKVSESPATISAMNTAEGARRSATN